MAAFASLRSSAAQAIPVFLLNIFAKNEKTNLTPKERQTLKVILANVVRTCYARKDSI